MKRIFFAALALVSIATSAATLAPVQLINPAGSTSGQAIVSTGASSAPAWGGVGLNGIAPVAANTVIGNTTGSTATPTAVSISGCNGAAQALQYTSGSGFGCNSGIATSGTNSNITSLVGLTTPITTASGGLGANNGSANGVPVFSSGTATVTATTGSGSVVLGTSPTIGTPNIQGVTNGSTAVAGQVGQTLTNSASGVSLTSGVSANCTSVSLTAGDWDVRGNAYFSPAGTTTQAQIAAGINTTSATLPAIPNYSVLTLSIPAGDVESLVTPTQIVNVSSTTTAYVVVNATFSTSTETASCFITARRIH
jgi:hypothetical protein